MWRRIWAGKVITSEVHEWFAVGAIVLQNFTNQHIVIARLMSTYHFAVKAREPLGEDWRAGLPCLELGWLKGFWLIAGEAIRLGALVSTQDTDGIPVGGHKR